VLAARSRRVFTVTAFVLTAIGVALTPRIYDVDWSAHLPPALAAYLGPATGSLFPLLPWAGFVLLGAGLGQIYARWDPAHLTRYANRALLLPGVMMVLIGGSESLMTDKPFGPGEWSFIPPQFLIRAGTCLVLLAALAHASRPIQHLPRVFGAVAQETLLIYFVHLCIVYGSVWNHGLSRYFAGALHPVAVTGVVVLLVAAMVALASYWNWWKHVRPQSARWISIGTMTALLARLL
jgi:hypothetical protein